MSTTLAGRRSPTAPTPHTSGPFTGTGTMVRFMLRRDRVRLPAWLAGHGLFVLYIAAALPQIAPTEDDLQAVVPLLQQPVGRMFTGPALGMEDPTYERFFASGYAPYLFLLSALMSLLLVVRHTRAEEQSGRAELVRANVAGRDAGLAATLLLALLANAGAALIVAALAAAVGFAPTGSVLVGLGTGLVGMAFSGVAAVTAQFFESPRAAAGAAGAVLGAAFMLRALGDMAAAGGSALSWTSPLGWAAQTGPYVLDRFWPLVPLAAVALVTGAGAFALQRRRDLGAGLVAERPGPGEASRSLGTPLGLAARLQRASIWGWGAAIVVLGSVDGAFTQVMVEGVEEMPETVRDMFGMEALVSGYLAFLAAFSGYLTTAYVVYAVQSLSGEEARGRAEAVLATPTSRTAWAGAHLLVVAAGAAGILVVAGLGTGVAAAAVTGDGSLVIELVAAHVNVLPAVLVVLAVCAVLYGWAPALLAPVGWALVGLIVFVGNFAAMLDLPRWLQNLSPLSYPAQLPVEDFALLPILVLLAIAVLGVGLGLVGVRRRQIGVR
ncbi:ABC transporter permease [Ornithinimicrobium pratense]|uniref:ABC transporter permease n=1 Tax=Ornithinimicrobium pratense TaxID=2593973 RepID=A0A5J6V7A4_9MICO|nr:ABC transporter permease [Ornithinimicrobium pratense]QFG69705.1 ABC transporter permease [Ornithinimicrobium pratense]